MATFDTDLMLAGADCAGLIAVLPTSRIGPRID